MAKAAAKHVVVAHWDQQKQSVIIREYALANQSMMEKNAVIAQMDTGW